MASPLTGNLTAAQQERWRSVAGLLAIALANRSRLRVFGEHADLFVDRLAAAGYDCRAGGPHEPADATVHLRQRTSAPATAEIVVDLTDPAWPVVRHIAPGLDCPADWHDTETRAFFAVRASTWDTRFGDDAPAYARAVGELGLTVDAVAVDVGCGTGRALPALHAAVGPQGTVIGIDYTEPMLRAAEELGRARVAHLLLADARRLPLADASVDGVFAAGLVGHLPDVDTVLTELARVCRPGGRMALFHPSGRAALAARHGRTLRDDEPLNEARLRAALTRCGWSLRAYDDPPDRFLALAAREH
jgi:SAM-dependent methyltransferase